MSSVSASKFHELSNGATGRVVADLSQKLSTRKDWQFGQFLRYNAFCGLDFDPILSILDPTDCITVNAG